MVLLWILLRWQTQNELQDQGLNALDAIKTDEYVLSPR